MATDNTSTSDPASTSYVNVLKTDYATTYKWGTQGFLSSGNPSMPGLTRGALTGTGIQFTNNNLTHSCDFKFNLSAQFSLSSLIPNLGILAGAIQNGKNAASAAIRTAITKLNELFRAAINAIIGGLNLDITGVFAAEFSLLKSFARDINEKLKVVAQLIADIATVYYLTVYVQEIINWVNSLPDRIKNILANCIIGFNNSLKSAGENFQGTLTDIQNQFTQGLQTSAAEDAAAAPKPSQEITNAVIDPINSNLDSLTNSIKSYSAVSLDNSAQNFSNLKNNSSKP
jgi:hypothetical protein